MVYTLSFRGRWELIEYRGFLKDIPGWEQHGKVHRTWKLHRAWCHNKSAIFLPSSKGHSGFPRWLSGNLLPNTGDARKVGGFEPWVGKMPWSRKWQPAPVFLPGKVLGQRSLTGYSSRGCKESEMTEWLSTRHEGPASQWLRKENSRMRRTGTCISALLFIFEANITDALSGKWPLRAPPSDLVFCEEP